MRTIESESGRRGGKRDETSWRCKNSHVVQHHDSGTGTCGSRRSYSTMRGNDAPRPLIKSLSTCVDVGE